MPTVEVIPLEWVDSSTQGRWARSLLGIYYASGLTQLLPKRVIFRWKLTVEGNYSEVFDTIEAAQDAAQLDYERRIRAALSPEGK